jgi:hypothetical protein
LDEIVKKDNDHLKSSVFNGYDPITGKHLFRYTTYIYIYIPFMQQSVKIMKNLRIYKDLIMCACIHTNKKMRHCRIFREYMTVSYDYIFLFSLYSFVTVEIKIRFEKRRSHAPIVGPGRPYRETRKRAH